MAKETEFRPHLACDFDEKKLKFPLIGMPKIDGVRGLNIDGRFVGRSKKRFDNPFLGTRFDGVDFTGFDGELAFGAWTSSTLCRDTTGFVNRMTAKPGKPVEGEVKWHIFDLLDEMCGVRDMVYEERLVHAARRVELMGLPYVKMVPHERLENLEQLYAMEERALDLNFEGLILRDPLGLHKSGRATVKAGAYLRVKRFIDVEGIVKSIIEANENTNEAKTNELGRTERSSHKENLVPKGMIGAVMMELLDDVEYRGVKLFEKGMLVRVGAGTMTHSERTHYFKNPQELLEKIGKVKIFPHGTKEKMRFPVWAGLRAEADMSS